MEHIDSETPHIIIIHLLPPTVCLLKAYLVCRPPQAPLSMDNKHNSSATNDYKRQRKPQPKTQMIGDGYRRYKSIDRQQVKKLTYKHNQRERRAMQSHALKETDEHHA